MQRKFVDLGNFIVLIFSIVFWNLFHFLENYSANSDIKNSIERANINFL